MRRREFLTGLGGAATWPLAARAQQPPIPIIGFLRLGPNLREPAFEQGLVERGYVPDRNVTIESRSANFQTSLLPRLAADLVGRRVAVIVTTGSPYAALAAKAATSTIPIIFMLNEDPVQYGLVDSLNRPGGNVTGVTFLTTELAGKRLNLLLELAPRATPVGYLSLSSDSPTFEARRSDMLAAGRALGREIITGEVRGLDFETAFATLVERRVGAVIVGNFTTFVYPPNRNKILELAARDKLPAMYPGRQYVLSGGLMSYEAANSTEQVRQAGIYAARVLKGERPANLPVMQPTKFELVINLTAAKKLGIAIPRTLLAAADEVIEYEFPRELPVGWNLVPTITVVSATGDPRLPLVGDAVAFWNDTLAELGTQFRLGALTQVAGPIPIEDVKKLATGEPELPESLKRIPGNIIVVLSEGEFISFTARRASLNKAVVAIKDYRSFPLTLPNVARNVIAHLLGLAIGLAHNADPTTLMCGRPAPCRPDVFASNSPKYFGLTEADKADVQRMYPQSWQASPAKIN